MLFTREDEGPKQPDKAGGDTAAPPEKKKEVKKTVKISTKVRPRTGGVRERLMYKANTDCGTQ